MKPGFFANEELTELPATGRLLFIGLWTLADRKGRLPDRPKWIKGGLFPYENVPVEKLLDQLQKYRFIVRYESEGQRFIQIVNFEKHQHPHQNEPQSTIPPPVNGGSTSDNVRSAPAKAKAIAKAESIADTPDSSPDASAAGLDPSLDNSDETGFALEYIRHYEQQKARPPSPIEKASARALERDFGAAACLEVANDLDWSKPPNYMRPILQERRDKPNATPITATRRSSRNGTDAADASAAWDNYRRGFEAQNG